MPRTSEHRRRMAGRGRPSRASGEDSSGPWLGLGPWLADHWMAAGLLAALTLALASEVTGLSRTIRAHILQVDVVAFFVLLAVAGPYREDLRRAAGRGPAPWLLALLAWCALLAFLPPARAFGVADLLRPFALGELVRMCFCGGVFFAAAYGLRANELRPVVFTVLSLGALVTLLELFQFGSGPSNEVTVLFGNHEQVGSYLMLLLPIAAALALDRGSDQKVLLGAQALAIVLAGGLLLARTRTAWIGELLALLTLAGLSLRYTTVRLSRANKAVLVGPLLILCLGLGLLVFSDQLAPLLSQRAGTFSRVLDDGSFGDRLLRWKAACRMAYERPLTGWGLGSYPILQSYWTGGGDAPAQVIARGPGHVDLAHNFWVQWAAETGAPGLFLYVGTVVAFLLAAGRALPAMRPGFRRTLLIGCLAATVAACGDMIGAPSYTFPGVSVLPWLWMGLGLAACRGEHAPESEQGTEGAPALPPTPAWVWIGASLAGLLAAAAVLAIGARQPAPAPPDAVASVSAPEIIRPALRVTRSTPRVTLLVSRIIVRGISQSARPKPAELPGFRPE